MKIALYIRTSTEEQAPENQIRDIETISGTDYILFKDKQSAWKDNIERENFEKLRKQIKLKNISDLYVWDLDRLFRNRQKLIEFFEFCKIYNCKVHSYRQQWLEELNNIPEPFNEMMFNLMLQIMGWLAEEESKKKSERVKLAVRKKKGKTVSYKGNKWGRKSLSTQKKNKLKELYKNNLKMSIRDISQELNMGIGTVHKYIAKIKQENSTNLEVQELSNL